ncbi:hypothetical protein BT69DRAFT_1303095 [Atractiella rhizophila]|nr:hypothetical protein BT69DRAFT_1303095 [Atractiella rhizophila]
MALHRKRRFWRFNLIDDFQSESVVDASTRHQRGFKTNEDEETVESTNISFVSYEPSQLHIPEVPTMSVLLPTFPDQEMGEDSGHFPVVPRALLNPTSEGNPWLEEILRISIPLQWFPAVWSALSRVSGARDLTLVDCDTILAGHRTARHASAPVLSHVQAQVCLIPLWPRSSLREFLSQKTPATVRRFRLLERLVARPLLTATAFKDEGRLLLKRKVTPKIFSNRTCGIGDKGVVVLFLGPLKQVTSVHELNTINQAQDFGPGPSSRLEEFI